jgi:hypothetical protein
MVGNLVVSGRGGIGQAGYVSYSDVPAHQTIAKSATTDESPWGDGETILSKNPPSRRGFRPSPKLLGESPLQVNSNPALVTVNVS